MVWYFQALLSTHIVLAGLTHVGDYDYFWRG